MAHEDLHLRGLPKWCSSLLQDLYAMFACHLLLIPVKVVSRLLAFPVRVLGVDSLSAAATTVVGAVLTGLAACSVSEHAICYTGHTVRIQSWTKQTNKCTGHTVLVQSFGSQSVCACYLLLVRQLLS
jgi:hypothetical protein